MDLWIYDCINVRHPGVNPKNCGMIRHRTNLQTNGCYLLRLKRAMGCG